MKFTSIYATGLKGRTFKHNLTPLTLITGDHEEGKSAIADALRLAGVGYDPKLGMRPMDTMRLATGDVMTVGVDIDGRSAGNQIWKRSAKGATKEGTPAANIPLTLFDLSEFLKMTGAERSKYVFSLADPEKIGFGVEAFVSALATIRVNATEAEFISNIVDDLRLKARDSEQAGKIVQQWLEEFYNDLDTRQKQADSTVKTLTQASRASVITAQELEEIPADAETQLMRKREMHRRSTVTITEYRSERNEIDRKLQAITEARAVLKGEDQSERIAELQRDIDQNEIEFDAFASDHPLLNQSELNAINKACDMAMAKESLRKAAVETAERKVREVEAELSLLKPGCKCSECAQKLPAKLLKELREQKEQSLITATGELTQEEVALKKAVESRKAAAKVRDDMNGDQATRQSFGDKRRKLRGEYEPLCEARTERNAAQAKIDAQGDTEELKRRRLNLDGVIADAETTQARLNDDIAQLQRQVNRLIARREQERSAGENKAQREKAETEARLLKAAKEAIGKERDKFNDKVWQSLLEVARRFTTGILKAGQLDFHEGELGYWREAQFVTYKTFSGAQRTLAFIGVAVALCQNSPIKIVILDEVASIHKYRRQTLERLQELVSRGVIDQALIIDPDPTPYLDFASDDFSTIKIGE